MMSKMLYDTLSGVSGINKVSNFDPRKFLKKMVDKTTGEVTYDLELKYKKLWFRLEHPSGRLYPIALQITDQLAIIECRVYFDKDKPEQAAGYIAQTTREKDGPLYLQKAQYIAEQEALSAAGFGCQFNDIRKDPDDVLVQVEELPSDMDVMAEPPEMEAKTSNETIAEAPPAEHGETLSAEPMPEENAETEPVPEESTDTADEQAPDAPPAETEVPPAENSDEEVVSNTDADLSEEPAEENAETPVSRFTPDMPVEEILALMTREEALAITVDVGTCNGWTLDTVLEKRPVSLRWLANGYTGDNNILRAGAILLMGETALPQAA